MNDKIPHNICIVKRSTLLCSSIIFYSALALFNLVNAAPAPKPQQQDKRVGKPLLAPYAFDFRWSDSRINDIDEQKSAPVCANFLYHVNHPRSHTLFNRDGSLVRESAKIKSVHWDRLEKETYLTGFQSVVTRQHSDAQASFLEIYADEHRILQRIMAHPEIDQRQKNDEGFWLYRLLLDSALPYDYNNPNSRVALPTWFPRDSLDWLGDEGGNFRLSGRSTLLGLGGQWFLHAGSTYMVHSRDYEADFNLDIYKMIIDDAGNSFMRRACVLRSKK